MMLYYVIQCASGADPPAGLRHRVVRDPRDLATART